MSVWPGTLTIARLVARPGALRFGVAKKTPLPLAHSTILKPE